MGIPENFFYWKLEKLVSRKNMKLMLIQFPASDLIVISGKWTRLPTPFVRAIATHKGRGHVNFPKLALNSNNRARHAVLSFTYITAKTLNILIPYKAQLTPFSRRRKGVPVEKSKLERHRAQSVKGLTSHSLKMGPYRVCDVRHWANSAVWKRQRFSL